MNARGFLGLVIIGAGVLVTHDVVKRREAAAAKAAVTLYPEPAQPFGLHTGQYKGRSESRRPPHPLAYYLSGWVDLGGQETRPAIPPSVLSIKELEAAQRYPGLMDSVALGQGYLYSTVPPGYWTPSMEGYARG